MKALPVLALSTAAGLAAGWFSLPLWHHTAVSPNASNRLPVMQESGRAGLKGDWKQQVQSIHSAGGPTAQLGAALALADSLAPEDYRTVLEECRELPPNSSQTFFFRSVLRRWTEADPEAAAAWCIGHASKQLGEVVRLWAATDPAAAQRFTAGLPADARSNAVAGIAEALAESDPKAALEYIRRSADPDSSYGLKEAFAQLAKSDPQWLLDHGDSLPGDLRGRARENAAEEFARRDFNAALAWASSQPDKREMLKKVLNGAKDPAPALAWLSAQEKPLQEDIASYLPYFLGRKHPFAMLQAAADPSLSVEAQQNLLPGGLHYAAMKDPAAAAAALQGFPAASIKNLAATVINPWLARDPAAAKAWAESLPDVTARESALAAIAKAESKPDASLPTTPKERLLANLKAGEYHANNTDVLRLAPEERKDVLQTLGADTEPNSASSQYAERIKDAIRAYYPEDYGAWLLTRPADEKTAGETAQFASGWAGENAPAAAAWAAKLPQGPARLETISRVAQQWHALDPASAAQWIATLSSSEQSRARQALQE